MRYLVKVWYISGFAKLEFESWDDARAWLKSNTANNPDVVTFRLVRF